MTLWTGWLEMYKLCKTFNIPSTVIGKTKITESLEFMLIWGEKGENSHKWVERHTNYLFLKITRGSSCWEKKQNLFIFPKCCLKSLKPDGVKSDFLWHRGIVCKLD